MPSDDYLYRGLCGLARAHRGGAMAGHLGAALVAGSLFRQEHPDLDPEVDAAVQKEMDRVLAGEETLWYDQEKSGMSIADLFAPFPTESPQSEGVPPIAEALGPNIDRLRQSGHNVTFASLALKALREHPEHATPALCEGIRKLIECFDGAGGGRCYLGAERGSVAAGEVALDSEDNTPPYDSGHAMAEAMIDELIDSASTHRQGVGGLFHLLNHTAGLLDLDRLGETDLAERGLSAHWEHLRIWRALPDLAGELGPLQRSEHSPWTPAYWPRAASVQWSGWLTHRIKTLYGFTTVLSYIDSPTKRREAEEQFLYLMA